MLGFKPHQIPVIMEKNIPWVFGASQPALENSETGNAEKKTGFVFFLGLFVGRNEHKTHGFWDAICILLGCKPTINGRGESIVIFHRVIGGFNLIDELGDIMQ